MGGVGCRPPLGNLECHDVLRAMHVSTNATGTTYCTGVRTAPAVGRLEGEGGEAATIVRPILSWVHRKRRPASQDCRSGEQPSSSQDPRENSAGSGSR